MVLHLNFYLLSVILIFKINFVKMFRIKMVELTAPVGTWASLRAAIDNGADSVYLGVGDLNMRSSSALNFSIKIYQI